MFQQKQREISEELEKQKQEITILEERNSHLATAIERSRKGLSQQAQMKSALLREEMQPEPDSATRTYTKTTPT